MITNDKLGSDNLRAKQIINVLNLNNIQKIPQYEIGTFIKKKNLIDEIKNYNNCIFLWIWDIFDINLLKLVKDNNNINIYDCVDNYVYNQEKIDNILNNNLIDSIIVNNNFMKNEFSKNINYKGDINVIYHHCDPIYTNLKIINQDELTFGYMGSLPSLNHSNNFLYYKKLMLKYPIEFLNTEDSLYYTNDVKHNVILIGKEQQKLDNMIIKFNCHISIRQINSKLSKYKTTAKIATAACLNHNIITTYEESVKDILPEDYPFLLKSDDFDTVQELFNIVIKDYYSDKILWNKGLQIMQEIKNKLNINNIKEDYIKLFEKYNL